MASSDERPSNPTPFFQNPNASATQPKISGRITAPPTQLEIAASLAKGATFALGSAIKWTSDQILGVGGRTTAMVKKKMADVQKARNEALEGTDLPVIPSASTSGTQDRPLVQRDGFAMDKEE